MFTQKTNYSSFIYFGAGEKFFLFQIVAIKCFTRIYTRKTIKASKQINVKQLFHYHIFGNQKLQTFFVVTQLHEFYLSQWQASSNPLCRFNPLQPGVAFLCSMKTSENLQVIKHAYQTCLQYNKCSSNILKLTLIHCVKSVQIRSFFWSVFS